MAKFRWLETEPKTVVVRGRAITVHPGDIVDLPDDVLVQTGATGEPAQWEPADTTPEKAARPQKVSK
ncbi:MAG: hypothetical protein IPJ61_21690 [Tessaracoccus sp.]|uniref:hypothetical protein n=1 Tax=Tessaracoccus sp. TaxID=1971211 RepID=UPI001ED6B321|nr:hypothetical protein [Tessaracoccus sp.]MBK7823603.1 hypothetical protein [Tessaracoccus sp.]